MNSLLFALLSLLVLGFCAPTAPKWPSKFYTTGIYTIPYGDISEPFSFWFDQENQRERIDWFYSSEREIDFFASGVSYLIGPEGTKLVCEPFPVSFYELTSMLPDLSGYSYQGQQSVNNITCDQWQHIDYEDGNHTYVYDFYVNSETQAPVQFHMNGPDVVFGSHPDIYIIDYATYQGNYQDISQYQVPSDCNGVSADSSLSEWKAWKAEHQRDYKHIIEHKNRFSIWKENKNYVDTINSKNLGYTLKMNHFGDMSDDEYRTMVPSRSTRPPVTQGLNRGYAGLYTGASSPQVPDAIDWRTLGAVTPVKDQGSCGSCWSFGATGSVEGAYAVQTGELLRLSEQQVVDCAWIVNLGCNGGYAQWAYEWLINNEGQALESSYKYLAQNSWCKSYDKSSPVKVVGYKNVTSGDESALKSAVAEHPVAIAIDASHLSFRFYAEGVYYEPDCLNGEDDLDHEVLVVGYGTDSKGGDYWIVKNSWSTHWGNEGYVWMARNQGNNCGIATDATFPLVSSSSLINGN